MSKHELKIDRVLKSSRKNIWRCWTEPALLEQWYCPKPWQAQEVDIDLRPGGRFNSVFCGPDDERMPLTGIWLEIIPEQRLIFTDAYSEDFWPQPESFMTGCVELSDVKDGTQMVWTARHTSQEAVEKHLEMGFEAGWNAAAGQLEELAKSLT